MPVIPATWTSLVVALLFLVVPLEPLGFQLPFLLEEEFGDDPKQATMDEAAGMAVSLLAVPLTPLNVLAAFVLFRVFDVIKPPPARAAESLPGGWGIMADDVLAGIYARLAMVVWLWLL